MDSQRVVAWQINCGPDSTPDKNLRKIKSCLQEAAAAGAKLALFPELIPRAPARRRQHERVD